MQRQVLGSIFFKKIGHSRSLFLFLCLFNPVNMFIIKLLPMTGFESWTCDIGSDHCANWTTTDAQTGDNFRSSNVLLPKNSISKQIISKIVYVWTITITQVNEYRNNGIPHSSPMYGMWLGSCFALSSDRTIEGRVLVWVHNCL